MRTQTCLFLQAQATGVCFKHKPKPAASGVLLLCWRLSLEVPQACKCLRDLNVPHFHHEFVKKVLKLAIERARSSSKLLELLVKCTDSGLVSVEHMRVGFQRMAQSVGDLELDVPGASRRLRELVDVLQHTTHNLQVRA